VREIEKLAQHFFISPSTPAQHAALAAFTPATLEILEERRHAFADRRNALLPALRDSVSAEPQGAFYLYADISGLADSSETLARRLIEEAGVAPHPASTSATTPGSPPAHRLHDRRSPPASKPPNASPGSPAPAHGVAFTQPSPPQTTDGKNPPRRRAGLLPRSAARLRRRRTCRRCGPPGQLSLHRHDLVGVGRGRVAGAVVLLQRPLDGAGGLDVPLSTSAPTRMLVSGSNMAPGRP
jgi:hypothetical protein